MEIIQQIEMTLVDYPKELIRFKNSIAKLSEWEESKNLYNVEYQSVKRNIEHSLERLIVNERMKLRNGLEDEIGGQLYWLIISARPDNFLKSRLKAISEINNKRVQEYIENTLSPCNELLNRIYALKGFIKKGRVVNENAKTLPTQKYNSKTADIKTIQRVKEIYTELLKEWRPLQIKGYIEHLQGVITRYEDLISTLVENSLDTNASGAMSRLEREYYQLFSRGKVKDDSANIALKMATNEVDKLQDRFIYKNVEKISAIVSKKGDLLEATIGEIFVDRGNISGSVKFKFKDGTFFTVINKTITVYEGYSRPFFRYPTTFHNIRIKNGMVLKSGSQEWMNEEFCKDVGENERN